MALSEEVLSGYDKTKKQNIINHFQPQFHGNFVIMKLSSITYAYLFRVL